MLALSAALACSSGVANSKSFDGFKEHFDLGRSAASGAVCQAARAFDDPMVARGARVWNVNCRGWSHHLGKLYLFPAAKAGALRGAWRGALKTSADCDFAAASSPAGGFKQVACKTKPDQLDYVVIEPANAGRGIAGEGMAPIADLLLAGLRFMSGASPEPAAIAEQAANVSQVSQVRVDTLALADSSKRTAEQRRREGYAVGHDWQFSEAESVFGALAGSDAGADASGAGQADRAEALYNLAMNVSNDGRFAEAKVYFDQADHAAEAAGADPSLRGIGLNYLAADARNQTHYKEAVVLADKAIAVRHSTTTMAPVERTADGGLRITEVGAPDVTQQISAAQREQLRDAQALEIKATSLEALGDLPHAREAIDQAIAILARPLQPQGGGGTLGQATPWLDTESRADAVRLYTGTDRAVETERNFRTAVGVFSRKYANSLPLAGYLVDLAQSEASSATDAPSRPEQENRALADYEAAFSIFSAQRGSLEASADLVRPYFDILLRRISAGGAADTQDVARFFVGAQTLIFQSSADAAKRLSARTLAGSEKAAGLARALEDTGRQIETDRAQIRDLQQRDAYTGAERARLDGDLKSLVAQSDTLESQLLIADPHYASLLRKSVELKDLQKALQPGEVYVKAFVLAERGYGLMITPTQATAYPIDLSREKARAMVAAFRRPIDNMRVLPDGRKSPRTFDVAAAHGMFEAIFGPVREPVLGAKLLIYEPDATLIPAPVAAFVTDEQSAELMKAKLVEARNSTKALDYVGVAWLGSKVSVTTALSATAFVQARTSRNDATTSAKADTRKPFLGFGDPVVTTDPRAFADVQPTGLRSKEAEEFCGLVRTSLMHIASLPGTVAEVTAVSEKAIGADDPSSRILGAAFTDGDIMRRGGPDGDLSHYKVLYFATHGILPQPNGCMQAALLTSLDPKDGDGLLDEKKIPQLNLNADMIVLSACDTGSKGDNSGGEALGGLVSTFVEAGARNVVVSNWEVDTDASIRLMEGMFAHRGETQAAALADAERSLMDSPDQYSHPYFWAPFMVVGDGALAMPTA
ncbi:MAG TPA: CHAT domain-containing protein [Caulobacteraceae bacterium]|jgi:CHAT domain-containing protein/tetratricopeptide (TPR) repeat protein|nr:CHAT domain-containing protein [Caulobacteraceae bacterium]